MSIYMAAGPSSLFQVLVSGLPPSTTEASIRSVCSPFGPLHSLHLSNAQARLTYSDRQTAEVAAAALNRRQIDGAEVTAELVGREEACVHVRGLPQDANEAALQQAFAAFGPVLSVKVDPGKGQVFAMVQFETQESAGRAIGQGTVEVAGTRVLVERFIPRTERRGPASSVYVRGFDGSYTEQRLKAAFESCGEISSCTINKDPQGGVRVYGFVNFASTDSVSRALQLNGQTTDGVAWFVSPASSQGHNSHVQRGQNEDWTKRNVYIAGFPGHLTQTNLQRLCETWGEVESVRMQPGGAEGEQGAAFVLFRREQDADVAIESLRRTLIERCKLQVSKWKPLESRKILGVSSALFTQWPFGLPFSMFPPTAPRFDRPRYHKRYQPKPHTVPEPAPAPQTFDLAKYNSLPAADKRRMIGEYIFFLLSGTYKETTGKITGMLLEMPNAELLALLQDGKAVMGKAQEAMEVLTKHRQGGS